MDFEFGQWFGTTHSNLIRLESVGGAERAIRVVHWDFALIPCYPFFLIGLRRFVVTRLGFVEARFETRWFVYLILAAGLFEMAENAFLLRLYHSGSTGFSASVAWAATVFATGKTLGLVLAMGIEIWRGIAFKLSTKSEVEELEEPVGHPRATAKTPSEARYPDPLKQSEEGLIYSRRRAAGMDVSAFAQTKQASPALGLALSGGGIRSATFCLGALQSIAFHDLLQRFDFLSTVSGGGYSGGAIGMMIARKTSKAVSLGWEKLQQ
ncbi:MAG: hypothetical protein EXS36_13030 [Pedosphaera sp.]|nr:hypothetical protein [Pedosphaera sp.]